MLAATHAARSTYGRMNKKVNEDKSQNFPTTVPDKTNVSFEASAPKLHSAEHIGVCLREMDEGLLVTAARSGDHTAFMELCGRHSRQIRWKIHRIMQNREDAEDAFQDTLLRAFLNLESFEGRSSFSSWLMRIAINSALGILRKKGTSELPLLLASDNSENWVLGQIPDRSETPEAYCERRQEEELLKSAILRLPPILREVVELRHEREYSALEIAELLGISVAAAKSRLSRARKAVRHLSISGAVRRVRRIRRSCQKAD